MNTENTPIPQKGKLYLIPVPLSPKGINYLPPEIIHIAPLLKYFFVEKIRTARRFLKVMNKTTNIDKITFSEVNRHQPADIDLLKKWLSAGVEVGLMSEAGCPGVADPGSEIVAAAHRFGAAVIPLPGPNAMIMALMASGFNGQCFRFVGYLPRKKQSLGKAITALERRSSKNDETQIFMEVPYRNNALLAEILKVSHPMTQLGIAADLTHQTEFIHTKSINEWRQSSPDLHKRPVVFTLFSKK